MRNIDELVIQKVLLNVIDKENNKLVNCNSEVELSDEVYEYFEKHILKCFKDEDAKTARLSGDKNIVRDLCDEILEDNEVFLENGKKIAHYIYKCICNDEIASSGDFAMCLAEAQDGKFLVLIKLDFNNCYMHYIKDNEGEISINITKSQTGLPSIAQKLQKVAIIKESKSTNNYHVLLIDKEAEGYFTDSFLNCEFVRDSRENTKIIKNVSESFARKTFKDNAHEAERFRNNVTDKLRSEDHINIEKLIEESFNDDEIKKEYKNTLVSEGIKENSVSIDKEWAEKKLKRKRLKVDKDIELYIDSEAYNNKDKFQIKRNGDGTIDIIIRNVKNYVER